ncbi:MAG TPA: hypothetical protein VKE23_12030 [Candidatus Limnocylindria bacterium]|nr:hypothetical protein [Candidatus Limnocylindria bacterium]
MSSTSTIAVTASPSTAATSSPRADLASLLRVRGGSWRPTGTTLLFEYPNGPAGTVLYGVPFSGPAVAVPIADLGTHNGWEVRPDGSSLVISLVIDRGTARIATLDLRGGSARWVTPDEPGVIPISPVWSPDGGLIYYSASTAGAISTDLGLFRVGLDGSARTRVRPPDGTGISLRHVTPDGDGVVFEHVRAGGSTDVLDLATGMTRTFNDNEASGDASWRIPSPRALVITGVCCAGPPGGNGTLWLWDDVSGSRQLVLGPGGTPPVAVDGADWNPSGTRIVASVYDRSKGTRSESSLVTVDPKGGAPTPIAETANGRVLRWISDGIVFVRMTAQGGTDVLLVPAAGRPQLVYSDPRVLGRLTLVTP